MDDRDSLDQELAALPARGPDELTRERVRQRARALLAQKRNRTPFVWRAAVTVALACTVCGYLAWAMKVSASLY
jgi:hypothetical protein